MKTSVLGMISICILMPMALTAQPIPQMGKILKPAPGPHKMPQKVLKSAYPHAVSQNPNVFDQGFSYTYGTASANYALSGEVWGVAIKDNIGPDDYSQAGFYSNGIQNTGTSPWKGVTVTAVVNVITITGHVIFAVGLSTPQESSPLGYTIDSPGTYTLVTQPEDMAPNIVYQGMAYMVCAPNTTNVPTGCYAKVVSIKINL